MLIKGIRVGRMRTNCYIAADEETRDCAVIDPGDEGSVILDYIEENKLKVCAVLLTHGHFDHTLAAEMLRDETGADIYISERDTAKGTGERHGVRYDCPDGTRFLISGEPVEAGSLHIDVLATPGHSPGSVVFIIRGVLFTGDTLFKDSCGRTDLPGGSMAEMLKSLRLLASIRTDAEVYPGHGSATSLDRERSFNFYMQQALNDEYEALS